MELNNIEKIFSNDYIQDLFEERILPLYPNFREIIKIKIKIHKKHLWDNYYHLVLEFKTYFLDKNNRSVALPIFCSAHSHEEREDAFKVLSLLWQSGFAHSHLSLPRPLFFDEGFNALFYRGVSGKDLLYYIERQDLDAIENIIVLTAHWLNRLHQLKPADAYEYNKKNSRIRTVVPGVDFIMEEIQKREPEYYEDVKKMYNYFMAEEENFLLTHESNFIHGDAHPENVIKTGENKIAFIDFTDISLGDFARDLGAFAQQIDYKIDSRISPAYAERIKNLFLEEYFKVSPYRLDESLKKRIRLYYNWTSMRTAIFLLTKHDPRPEKAKNMISTVKERLSELF